MYMQAQPMMVAQPQPMMMMAPQPMMMAPQPMMMMQQPQMQMQQPQPNIIINQGEDGDCPRCKNGHMYATKEFTAKTCLICCCFWPGLICDCAWGTKRVCPDCQWEVSI